jgi:hypothetical protein
MVSVLEIFTIMWDDHNPTLLNKLIFLCKQTHNLVKNEALRSAELYAGTSGAPSKAIFRLIANYRLSYTFFWWECEPSLHIPTMDGILGIRVRFPTNVQLCGWEKTENIYVENIIEYDFPYVGIFLTNLQAGRSATHVQWEDNEKCNKVEVKILAVIPEYGAVHQQKKLAMKQIKTSSIEHFQV